MLTAEQVRAAGGSFNPERYYRYMDYRAWFEYLFQVATTPKPIKFPARRRRSDREIPPAKAA